MNAGKARETLRELGGVLGLTFKAKEEPPMDIEPLKKLAASIYEKAKAARVSGIAAGNVPG